MPTIAQIPGNFKQRYWKYINPLPSMDSIANLCPLVSEAQQEGDSFVFPVQTSWELGQTANSDGSGFTINSAIGQSIKQALIRAAYLVVSVDLPTSVLFKSKNAGDGATGGAFLSGIELGLKGGLMGAQMFRDLALAYGPGPNAALASNIGVVNTTAGGTLNTVQQVILTRASFIPGLWQTYVTGLVDIYQSDGTTPREVDVVVIAYPVEGSTRVSFQKVGSGATPTATDVIVPKGWRTTSCFGMESIYNNAGSMFGIDASITPFWKCQQVSANSGPLSFALIQTIGAKSSLAGNTRGGVLLVTQNSLIDLANETRNNPQFVEGTIGAGGLDTKTQGASNYRYKTPCGVIEVMVHQLGKQGQSMFVANMEGESKNLKRVGSTDITLDLPGDSGGPLRKDVNRAAQNLQYFSHQAPIFPMPRRNILVTGLLNSGDCLAV